MKMKVRADDDPVKIVTSGFRIRPIVRNFAVAKDYYLKYFTEEADEQKVQKVQKLLKDIENIFMRTKASLDAPGIRVLISK